MWRTAGSLAITIELKLAESEEMRHDRAYLEQRRMELMGEGFSCEAVLLWVSRRTKSLSWREKRTSI